MIAAGIYFKLFQIVVTALIGFVFLRYWVDPQGNTHFPGSRFLQYIFILALIVFIGLRPLSEVFADMMNYKWAYDNDMNHGMDYGYYLIGSALKKIGIDSNGWFLFIAICYVINYYVACRVLFGESSWIGFLFCLCSLGWLSYGVNTIRTGWALSILFLALALLYKENFRVNIPILLLVILSVSIHKSLILPVFIGVVCACIKNMKISIAISIWVICLVLSLTTGSFFNTYFAGLNFGDERIQYLTTQQDRWLFRYTGFRWDFVLYSTLPIIVYLFNRKIRKHNELRKSTHLINTYILTNAIWLLIISANYSDRFAYLSWFLYPVCLSTLLINTFNDKKQLIASALLLYCILGWMI